MEDNNKYSHQKVWAIKKSIGLGKTLQKEHPEIAELYKKGYSLLKIVEKINVQLEYGVGNSVSSSGVHRAIVGHCGGFGIEAFKGLIPNKEEREEIGRKHRVECSQKIYEEGKGIHGRTAEKIIEDARKGGNISGRKNYEKGKGVHGRSTKQMSEDGRKSAIARGLVLWIDEEMKSVCQLSLKTEFQHSKGRNKGTPNYELIALELNIKYHDYKKVRTAGAVSNQLHRYRKSLEAKVD